MDLRKILCWDRAEVAWTVLEFRSSLKITAEFCHYTISKKFRNYRKEARRSRICFSVRLFGDRGEQPDKPGREEHHEDFGAGEVIPRRSHWRGLLTLPGLPRPSSVWTHATAIRAILRKVRSRDVSIPQNQELWIAIISALSWNE